MNNRIDTLSTSAQSINECLTGIKLDINSLEGSVSSLAKNVDKLDGELSSVQAETRNELSKMKKRYYRCKGREVSRNELLEAIKDMEKTVREKYLYMMIGGVSGTVALLTFVWRVLI